MATSALLTIMVGAVRKASRSLKRDFGEIENLQGSLNGPAHFTSAAMRRAEKIICDELLKARPTYAFVTEGNAEIKGTDGQHRWIIDALGGTTNFRHALPIFSVSIALERNHVPVNGVIYNPITDELFTSERGSGVFLNNHRLRVANRRHLSDCVAAGSHRRTGNADRDSRAINRIARLNQLLAGIRCSGAAALDLAYVAAGRYDLMWDDGLAHRAIAAGVLMVREAGGLLTDHKGRQISAGSTSILAGNEQVHSQLLRELKST